MERSHWPKSQSRGHWEYLAGKLCFKLFLFCTWNSSVLDPNRSAQRVWLIRFRGNFVPPALRYAPPKPIWASKCMILKKLENLPVGWVGVGGGWELGLSHANLGAHTANSPSPLLLPLLLSPIFLARPPPTLYLPSVFRASWKAVNMFKIPTLPFWVLVFSF